MWAVGLMTGTVLDGNIDVALLRTDGESIAEFGPYALIPYPSKTNDLLVEALAAAQNWGFAGPRPEAFATAEAALTEAQTEAVRHLVDTAGLKLTEIGVVGFHGQTVLHRAPEPGRLGQTCQLGDGDWMARHLGVPVVHDFRSEDMRAGGQGAPLAAIYHAALLKDPGYGAETAVLNLGGVGNVSWTDGETLVAFDTGPANAPINDFLRTTSGLPMDRGGQIAAAGKVDEARLATLAEHAYFSKPYPKSLDRNSFTAAMAEGLGAEDGAALLTAFAAMAVGKGLDLLPNRPSRVVVAGGGRHNPTLLDQIAKRAKVEIVLAEDAGWRGDAVEAECFGFLAARVLRGLPVSFPSTTGAAHPVIGGRIAGGSTRQK